MIESILNLSFYISIFTFTLWNLMGILPDRKQQPVTYPHVSVVIPAHDEEKVIAKTIHSVLGAAYEGKVEVVVVDDGSRDGTADVVKKIAKGDRRLRLIKTDHLGKARAVNRGIKASKGELVMMLDADSELASDGLKELARPFADPTVGAVSGIIRVALNSNPLVWYQDFEYVLSSMWRYIFDKMGISYILPGFCGFRRDAIVKAGLFETDTLSEDFDVGLRLRKMGYRIIMSRAVMHTHVPQSLSGIAKQRIRWGKGTVQVIRKHKDMIFNLRFGLIGLYGLPNQIYFFVQGAVLLPITVYQIFQGYFQYFVSTGQAFSLAALKFFVGWMSIFGGLELTYNVLTGVWESADNFYLWLVAFSLTYFYHILAAKKMSGFNLRLLAVLCFFFPYYLFTLVFFLWGVPSELNPLKKLSKGANIWEKNR